MSPIGRRLLLIALAVAAAVAAAVWLGRADPVKVRVTMVGEGTVASTLANTRAGEVESCRRAKLSTISGGRIERIEVSEGDDVVEGQLLMTLWAEDQAAQLAVARAGLESARKRVGEVCTQAANAADEARRQTALLKKGFVSASREEQARADATARRAACATARADVQAAAARVAASETDQRRTRLLAPFAGTIAKITGKLGEYTTPSPPGVAMPPAIDLIDRSCLYVTAPMDEVDAPRIRVGQTATITLDAMPERHFAARVKRIAPYVATVERQARTVDIDVEFQDPADTEGLLVGYSADVEILLDRREQVLRIPTAAIREGNRILVLGADGLLQARTVETGLSNWEFTEVVGGLAHGEAVVTSLEREGVEAGRPAVIDATDG
ncbi:MAG: efflux RND transporter periplasmic adaptor subunit [Rhodocyclaceae bacterium]|nr:efflux RND transporter periplasmic adaptor subunit [Rhodocyclaceae bacterium]